jgi:hypothetical protein
VLSNLPDTPYYYQFPMGIIGKVYATSMLVLLNSRMILDSEEIPNPSTIMITSIVRFGRAPSNGEIGALEAHNGDISLSTMIPKRDRELRDVLSCE